MIRTLHEGLLADGIAVPLTKLCAWFGVPRRTVYYRPTKSEPKVDPRFAEPIKALIEKEPSFGYRWLLGFNKNTVQRIFQIKGWQVRKRSIGARPRIEALPSVAQSPNERWSTDLARVWPVSGPCLARVWPVSGPARTAGPRWRWSWIATPESFSAGTSHAAARRPRRSRHWNTR